MLAERAEVGLSVELESDDLEVLADRDRIVQVLLGFVDNALKHSPAEHDRAPARASRGRMGAASRSPTKGRASSPSSSSHVFDRFYRADQARAGRRGAGLGLAIAKEIVEAHGSQISVASVPGHGATFGFRLPMASARFLTRP